jgi:hypothetical protein
MIMTRSRGCCQFSRIIPSSVNTTRSPNQYSTSAAPRVCMVGCSIEETPHMRREELREAAARLIMSYERRGAIYAMIQGRSRSADSPEVNPKLQRPPRANTVCQTLRSIFGARRFKAMIWALGRKPRRLPIGSWIHTSVQVFGASAYPSRTASCLGNGGFLMLQGQAHDLRLSIDFRHQATQLATPCFARKFTLHSLVGY